MTVRISILYGVDRRIQSVYASIVLFPVVLYPKTHPHRDINKHEKAANNRCSSKLPTDQIQPSIYIFSIRQLIHIMKLLLVAALISSSAAFAPAPISRRSMIAPLSESATASAIEAALEASKTHGPTSQEARLLWEVVEEMNASDNRCVPSIGAYDRLGDICSVC